MKLKLFLTAFILSMNWLSSTAFKLVSEPSDSIIPSRSIELNPNGFTVTYKFEGAISISDELYKGCTRLDIPGFGLNSTAGEPAWPIRTDSFEIPDGCEASVEVISEKWDVLDISLSPSRPLLYDSIDEEYTTDNVPPIKYTRFALPEKSITIQQTQVYRDRKILFVNVIPIKFIDSSKILACETITYQVNFKASGDNRQKQSSQIFHDVDEDLMSSIYSATLTNSDIDKSYSPKTTVWENAPYYLILSVPEYRPMITNFIDWKKMMGYNAYAIYSYTWDPTKIKETIQKAYRSIKTLQFVLLVGDALAIPPVRHPESKGTFAHSSDFTYGCMDGDEDTEQDIIIGRLSVSNTSEASTVISKIINYEKDPPINESFYKNAVHAAYFEDSLKPYEGYEDTRFTRTSEDIRNGLNDEKKIIKRIYFANSNTNPTNWNNRLYGYGEDLPSDLLKPTFKWDGITKDVINAINSGAFYIFHRGHGSYSGWSAPTFRINAIQDLDNKNLLPVCFSINCQTGAFGHTEVIIIPSQKKYKLIEQSFSEALLRKPMGGAVGIIAASELSFSGPNDALAMELFHAIWPNSTILTDFPQYSSNGFNQNDSPIYSIGGILRKGMSQTYAKFANITPYTKRIYHCFGDPSMEIHTTSPNIQLRYFNKIRPYIIETSAPMFMSLVLKNGSVLVSRGTRFDFTQYKDQFAKYMLRSRNMRPILSDEEREPIDTLYTASGFSNFEYNQNCLNIEFEDSSIGTELIRIRSIFNTDYCQEYMITEGKMNIPTYDFKEGTYSVELVKNGNTIDSRKIYIK